MATEMYAEDVAPAEGDVVPDKENEIDISCGHLATMYTVSEPVAGDMCCDVEKRKMGKFDKKVCLFTFVSFCWVCLFIYFCFALLIYFCCAFGHTGFVFAYLTQ
jgi:hypothetical protein